MKFFLSLVSILFLLSSCSSTPEDPQSIEQMIDGWREMVNTIQASSANPDELRRRTFLLHVKINGNWNIGISPRDAFEIKKDLGENDYKVYVVNPYKLFENRGGLTRMTYIQGSLVKVGGMQGDIELGANVECIFKVRFFQDNGLQINFTRLQEAYNYEFISEPKNALKIHNIYSDSATFIRQIPSDEPVTLRLKLEDKTTKETSLSNEITIPHCSRLKTKSRNEIFIPRSPDSCVSHLKTEGNTLEKNTESKMPLKETFVNSCPLPVVCKLKAQYGYIQKKKVVFMETKEYDFEVAPESFETLNTSFLFSDKKASFDSKLYKAFVLTKQSLPEGVPMERPTDYLTCDWKKEVTQAQ